VDGGAHARVPAVTCFVLTWQDVDLEARTMRIARTLQYARAGGFDVGRELCGEHLVTCRLHGSDTSTRHLPRPGGTAFNTSRLHLDGWFYL
jgi:hypothetical protein